jgi:pimeloyl-ACP methyl ester carboxylesterase
MSPVVLLLPGMTLNATIFPPLDLPTVSIDFTRLVLGPDGASPELAARRIGMYADFLSERLRREAAWNALRRIVVAHSFGGMLALAWWLANRGSDVARVDGMVLIATTAGPMFDSVRLRLGSVGGVETRVGISWLVRLWNRPTVTRTMKRLLTGGSLEARPVDFRSSGIRSDWALDRAGWRNTDWRAMRAYRLAMEGFDVRDRLGEIAVPIIVLHGTADTLLPPQCAKELAAGLPHAELRLVQGAGHALPLTHSKQVGEAVGDLVARVEKQALSPG